MISTPSDKAEHMLSELGMVLELDELSEEPCRGVLEPSVEKVIGQAGSLMRCLIYNVQPDRRMQLTIGETDLHGNRHVIRDNKPATTTPVKLETGTQVELERVATLSDVRHGTEQGEQYIGSGEFVFRLWDVISAIRGGGRLSVVEVEQ